MKKIMGILQTRIPRPITYVKAEDKLVFKLKLMLKTASQTDLKAVYAVATFTPPSDAVEQNSGVMTRKRKFSKVKHFLQAFLRRIETLVMGT